MATLRRLFGSKNLQAVKTLHKISHRNFSKSQTAQTYQSDGKTYITVLNQEKHAPLMIDSYSLMGFRLNNGLFVVGPIALFPQTILSWNVKDDKDITEKSLSLFFHLAPKLDIMLIGLSDARDQRHLSNVRRDVVQMMHKFNPGDKMSIEVMPTEKAVTTYNFLNSEQRFVGAALVPPTFYSPTLFDRYRTEYLHKKKEEGDYITS